MARISNVERIAPDQAAALKAAGISSTEQLLERGGFQEQRSALVAESGIDEITLMPWLTRADLERILGIGWDFAELIAEAGIETVPDLAQADAESLREGISTANAKLSLVTRMPSIAAVQSWIDEAKTLEPAITYAPNIEDDHAHSFGFAAQGAGGLF